jgi:two-component system, OmpR family, phosphate regulon sensor histidine kinase PhoR
VARPYRLWPAGVTARLWAGLAVFVLLVLTAAGLLANGLGQQDRAVNLAVRHLQPLATVNLEIRAEFADSQVLVSTYTLTHESRFTALYRIARDGLDQKLRSAARLSAGRWRALIAAQQAASRLWYIYATPMLSLRPGSHRLALVAEASYPSAEAFYHANDQLNGELRGAIGDAVTTGRRAVDRAVAVGAGLAALAVLLGLVGVAATVRGITRPLRGLVRVLRRLAAGDQGARALLTGPEEIREVARSLNDLADESEQLRGREAESNRMRQTAREVGLRIREHLRVSDLVREAQEAIEENLAADMAYMHVIDEDGRLGLPLGHERDWMMPPEFLAVLERGEHRARLESAYRRRASLVVQDITGPEGERIPPAIRERLMAAGIIAQVLVPFGAGNDLLGIVVALRTSRGHPWTEAEVAAIESIAADLGSGLHQARLFEAENHLVSELRAVDQAKSDFLATVSHELRTPLTSIAGYVEILRDRDAGPLTMAQEQMLATVERNAARLRHLIEDVLTLSKIESGAFTSSKQPVDLAEILTAAAVALQPAAAVKGLTFTVEQAAGHLMVAGDPAQLDRVVMNLLSNAVKFTPEGGRVTVGAAEGSGMAVLTVADTGIGIPEDEQKGLFTRFFRAANAVYLSIPGTGLGLAIVRTIVANHGGEMDVTSREGSGTSVTVRIPLLVPGARHPSPEVPAVGGGRP